METAIIALSVTVVGLAVVLVVVVMKLVAVIQEPAKLAEAVENIKKVTASAQEAIARNKPK
jgi:hypothetical protein